MFVCLMVSHLFWLVVSTHLLQSPEVSFVGGFRMLSTVENGFPESVRFHIVPLPNQYTGNWKVEIWLDSLAKRIGASSCNLHGQTPSEKELRYLILSGFLVHKL